MRDRFELKKIGILYLVGFISYITIEVIWTSLDGQLVGVNGKSFWTLGGFSSLWMGLLGGFIFILLGLLNEIRFIKLKLPLALQALIGSFIITTLEFLTGLIFNVWLGFNIWNYEGLPLAHLFLNQINLFHSLMWFILSPLAFWLDDTLRWVFYKVGFSQDQKKYYNFFWYLKHLFKLKPPILEDKKIS